ncbi:MAG: ABC transporter ATP-binding protein [Elusimicrobiota bacterium]|nr:ABC transporter ATP-binding protein [Endomicrobiia bacterium]MDW8165732.1 ABC transporter ATP-binding protein [Elusimicrobiota bacterium]
MRNLSTAIKLEEISKIYISWRKRKTVALDSITLEIPKGSIFTLLGPNGAGKTTLLNIIIGLITPDRGKVFIMGKDTTKNIPLSIKSKLNMCSGNPNFPWCMKVKEILEFYCYLYGISPKESKRRIERLIEIFELQKHINTRFDELSTGTKQKLALAKSLINNPEILLLDEPTLGLDPEVSIKLREFIKKIHQEEKITILLTTHYMKEAEELSEIIAFINNGKIISIGTRQEVLNSTNSSNLEEAFVKLAHENC